MVYPLQDEYARSYVRHSNCAILHECIEAFGRRWPKPLSGQEFRLLRVEMDLSQKHLAAIIGAKEQTLRLWKRGRHKAVPGPADRLMRILYAEFVGSDGKMHHLVEQWAELDQMEAGDAFFQKTGGVWRLALAA